jgi:oligosaccharide repeat unit polymerase
MIYYAVLGVASLLFLALGLTIWLKTRSIAFLIGLGFIYYWTLWGSWFIVYDLRGGNSGFQYDYLYYKLFAIHLDSDYFWALVLYSIFILFVEIALLLSLRPGISQPPGRPIRISHRTMILIAAVSGITSFWIVKGTFSAAADLGEMAYHYVYEDASISRWFTLHQILNRICLFTATMGLAIHYSGNTARYIVAHAKLTQRVTYLIVLSGIFVMNLMLGFRQNMVVIFLTSALFYLANCRKPKIRTIVIAGSVALFAVGVVGMTRGAQVSETVQDMGILKAGAGSVATYAVSNEPFVAHMSMYGSLHKGVELTYGSSIIAFIASWIPKIVWLNRPQEISLYYAHQVGSIDGQGYTIHHATGWYLNFGTVGVVFGAVLLGWVWGALWNEFHQVGKVKSYWGRFFRIIGFWSFTASIPTVIRGGPEVYKLILLEVLLIPTLILGIAGARLVLKFNRPRLLFGEDVLFPIVRENSSTRRVSPV